MPRLARISATRVDRRRPPMTPAQARVVSLSQWITPTWLADLIVDVADIGSGNTVLEPSAGTGSIVRAALARGASVEAVEIDRGMVRRLRAIDLGHYPVSAALRIHQADFLRWAPPRSVCVDLAASNTPFESGADLRHMLRALTLVRRVVAVLRLNAVAGQERYEALWSRFDVRQVLVLPQRPDFGEEARRVGMLGTGAESDFCIVDVLARPRRRGSRPSFDWVRRPG